MPRKPRGRAAAKPLTVRLNPETELAFKLLNRTTRKSLSEYVQSSAESFVAGEPLFTGVTAGEAVERIWADTEGERLVNLALEFGDLLNPDERLVWNVIRELPGLWDGPVARDTLQRDLLVEHWDEIQAIARLERTVQDLPADLQGQGPGGK